jgi:hypothetical protein
MLRTCSRIIALTAMVAGPSMTAQAADGTLTLACQGTKGPIENPNLTPISMGIIVNFTAGTVHGFGGVSDPPVKITGVNEVIVAFSDFIPSLDSDKEHIEGSINRVTGDVHATATWYRAEKIVWMTAYALKCRPTQRMF